MTAHVIDRVLVTKAMFDLLETNLAGRGTDGRDYHVGMATAPDLLLKDTQNRLIDPYAILYVWPSPWLYGSLQYPEDGANLIYQVTSVGRTYDSCLIMSDLIRRIVVERSGSGAYVYPIPADQTSVLRRRQRSFGTVTPDNGLWKADDVYDLEVQANG